jgi:hypothetical protein
MLLNEVLTEIERILKPNNYFSLMFNSLDDETWMNLITRTSNLTFDLEQVETLEYSANSVVQDTRRAGLKTDFVLTFRKDLNKTIKNITLISVEENRDYIIGMIEDYSRNTGKKQLETYQVLNLLVSRFLHQDNFFRLSEVLTMLKKDFKKEENKWTISGI